MSDRPAAIFDNDGLLLDTEEAWTRAEITLFAGRGRRFTETHKRALLGTARADAEATLERMLDRPGEGPALMSELHDLVMEEVLAGVQPRPGALALIARLLDAGRPLGLASNAERAFVERTLRTAGLYPDGPFAVVVAGDEVTAAKPAPDIYLEACARLGVAVEEAVALEDSPTGVAAAAAAGLFVVGVPYLAGMALPGSHLLATRLDDPQVGRALGLEP